MTDRPIEAAQTSADMRCPDCLGSEFPGFKRGVRCATCKGTATRPTPAAAAPEPTQQMLDAGLKAMRDDGWLLNTGELTASLALVFKAMLAASGAPAGAPSEQKEGSVQESEIVRLACKWYDTGSGKSGVAHELALAVAAYKSSVHQAAPQTSVPKGVHSGEAPASAPLAGGSAKDIAESNAIFAAIETSLEGRSDVGCGETK